MGNNVLEEKLRPVANTGLPGPIGQWLRLESPKQRTALAWTIDDHPDSALLGQWKQPVLNLPAPNDGAQRHTIQRPQPHNPAENQKHATWALGVYKAVEQGLADFLLDNIDLTKFLFIGMFALAAAIAAMDADHIALRLPRNRAEWRLSQGVQFGINGLTVLSLNAYMGRLDQSPGS